MVFYIIMNNLVYDNQFCLEMLRFQTLKPLIHEAQRNYQVGIFDNLKWLTFNYAAIHSMITIDVEEQALFAFG